MKYKESKWFMGLKSAERHYKDGWKNPTFSVNPLRVNFEHACGATLTLNLSLGSEYDKGFIEYMKYYREHLEENPEWEKIDFDNVLTFNQLPEALQNKLK